jgi:hypothetical protein
MNARPGQTNIYEAIAARAARDMGMQIAADAKNPLLDFAREGIRRVAISRDSRQVNADDVQQFLVDCKLDEGCLGNAAGSVFKDGGTSWRFVRYEPSKRKIARARVIRVWEYVG